PPARGQRTERPGGLRRVGASAAAAARRVGRARGARGLCRSPRPVTTGDTLAAAISAYAAGLDAEMELLRQLAQLSSAQRSASGTAEPDALARFSDDRTRLLNAVVTLEHELKPLRQELAASADHAARLPGFQAVVS